MRLYPLVLLFGIGPVTLAQNAKVIVLEKVDSDKIKQLYEQQAMIAAKIKSATDEITEKYVGVTQDCTTHKGGVLLEHCNYTMNKPGWEMGIQFSDDFKAIIPIGTGGGGKYYSNPMSPLNPNNPALGGMFCCSTVDTPNGPIGISW